MRYVPIPQDGNCLFHAVACCIGTTPHHARVQASAYIAAHKDDAYNGTTWRQWIDTETGETVEAYTARMRLPGVWGGEPELRALAASLPAVIHVYQPSQTGYRHLVSYGHHGRVAYLVFHGNHYDALLP